MKALRVFTVALAVLSVCSLTSAAEFFDDFESYVAGDGLHGQNNWEGWDGAISYDSPASDAYAYSGSTSVEIIGTADLVQPFGVAGGQWILSAMMYAPSGTTGETMFIVLNQYPNDKDWSIQTHFFLGTGEITSSYDDEVGTIVYDEWVELKMVIDLDNNTVDEYYNGELLYTHDWDDDPADPPGIGCLDLFGNSASSVYYDDIQLLEVATMPTDHTPADEATDVARDVTLEWTPGTKSAAFDVYLSSDPAVVAAASRADTMGVQIGQDLASPSVAVPEMLELGGVYYWRVDVVRYDGAVDKGEVWSFTAEPAIYAIQNIVATSNVENTEGEGPENTVNGSGLDGDQHSADTADMWTALIGDDPVYIQWEFDDVYPIGSMEVWNHNFIFEMALGIGIQDATVEYSTDGVEWMVFGDVVLAQATGQATYTANTTVDMEDVPAKYVRLTVNSNYGSAVNAGLSEVRFLYEPKAPRYPEPADGATDVDVFTALDWRPGRAAATHELYMGTDPNALSLVATPEGHAYDADLALDTTYYWQVVEVNEADTPAAWAGHVWSFTTEAVSMIDDFETYDDNAEAGTAIWATWIDGLVEFGGDAANGGGVVGNDVPPYAEQTFVLEGNQAMPFSYDNVTYSFSQTTRTFAAAQDWSGHGFTTLTVWVKGDPSLSASDTLYVAVNGTKVVCEGDLTAPVYLPFNADLASLGNLSNVTTLSIGVDGSGQGTIYIDNVALHATAPVKATAGDKSLVAHWTFDETEGLTAADSSGYGNDGTLVGMDGTEWTTGMVGGALEFAGTEENPQYVDFGATGSLRIWDSVTMSAWVKMNPENADAYMGIGGRLNTAPYVGFALVRHSSNVFRLWANSEANELAGFDASSDETYTDTEWHHVVGVVDAGTSMLYVDGVKQAQEGAVDLTASPGYAHIGKQYNSETVHRYWNGLIDDVRIYYRALSAQEIAGL